MSRNDKLLLIRRWKLYEDVQPIHSGLDRPEIRDGLLVFQLFDTFVVRFERWISQSIIILRYEVYIDLIKHIKVSHNIFCSYGM